MNKLATLMGLGRKRRSTRRRTYRGRGIFDAVTEKWNSMSPLKKSLLAVPIAIGKMILKGNGRRRRRRT